MDIRAFWSAVLSQDRKALPEYFCRGAVIRWHCSNERFTVEEYVRANCDYPGQWAGEIERIERTDGTVITAVRCFPRTVAPRSMSRASCACGMTGYRSWTSTGRMTVKRPRGGVK